jgi:DNA-binding response OmpR family regulator
MAKILVLEDNERINQAYKIILEKEGHTVRVAFDGKQGLKVAEEFDPEIILLDIDMPVMDGLDFMRNFDVANKHPNVKVVIMSNLDKDQSVEEALRLGAYKYILKARASPRQLATLINHLINKNLDKKPEAEATEL